MTTRSLKLADGLSLPADEAATQKYGFIGRSGSGKSYAAMRLAELFLEAGAQIIALDWVGIWWSLRLAANGKAPGFEHVYIFGGEHADVDLRPESGALMADLVVDKHISVVLDVMHFRKAERTRFATAFAEQFFHRKKTARTACHLFIEEAQAYLPQMVRGEEARMVGVFEDIGKVGRNYGIGNSLISQRPQAINKDVLNQIEVLLAFQTNGPQERKAIAGWTAENTDAGAAMMHDLPKLHVGDALVWSPQWLRVAEKVHVSARETYDASSTPTQHAKSIKPKTLAKADLEQLGEQITATIEKAKQEDPKELKKQIAELKKQLSTAQAVEVSSKTLTKEKRVEVLTDADRALLEQFSKKLEVISAGLAMRPGHIFTDLEERLRGVITNAVQKVDEVSVEGRAAFLKTVESKGFQRILGKLATVSVQPSHQMPPRHAERTTPARPPERLAGAGSPGGSRNGARPAVDSNGNGVVKGGKFRALMIALAQAGQTLTAEQLVARAGMSLSGTFDTYIGQMRQNGWIDGTRAALALTAEGLAALGPYEPLPIGEELRRYWLDQVSGGKERAMLQALFDAYPKTLTADEVAERAAMALSGTFDTYIGHLRRLLLVEGTRAALRANSELFS